MEELESGKTYIFQHSQQKNTKQKKYSKLLKTKQAMRFSFYTVVTVRDPHKT